MAASTALSPAQFTSSGMPRRTKDPQSDPKFNRVKFSGGNSSKTMHIARGHVPKPPDTHPHHRKSGKRSRRAR